TLSNAAVQTPPVDLRRQLGRVDRKKLVERSARVGRDEGQCSLVDKVLPQLDLDRVSARTDPATGADDGGERSQRRPAQTQRVLDALNDEVLVATVEWKDDQQRPLVLEERLCRSGIESDQVSERQAVIGSEIP